MRFAVAALRADGPQLHRGIGVTLPAVDGVSIRLDTLISLPGSWLLYLCARPQWWDYGPAGRLEDLVDRIQATATTDATVASYAAQDARRFVGA